MTRIPRRFGLFLIIGLVGVVAAGCTSPSSRETATSAYPIAVDARKVGSYPALTKSGAGYFYDDVLEYRVWINPPEGGDDYYKAFARHEDAEAYATKTPGAEEPLVLVRQNVWIDEPKENVFIVREEERLTEWQVAWLANSKRTPGAIEAFLQEHRPKKTKELTDKTGRN